MTSWPTANRECRRNDLSFATFESYRKILQSTGRPAIGGEVFEDVKYSRLAKIVEGKKGINKKTHNNIVSVIRCAFEYGYRDHPEKHNPASALKCFRLSKKDRRPPDPFTIQEAEALIAAIHRDWGEVQGNYDEFRFFTGLRPSEQIALLVDDCDLSQGKLKVSKACVMIEPRPARIASLSCVHARWKCSSDSWRLERG